MNNWMVRDSVYGNINVKETVIIELINSKEFQRLRRILQLGGNQFAFPTAVHTRFSHSLGVYYLIDRIFKNSNFSHLSPEEQLLTKIAGLLHDIGHGPFSHSFEKVSKKSHETWTINLIQSPQTAINQILRNHNIDYKQVCEIINKTHSNKIITTLVSSQLDCDRMDYLLRDSYHTGVEYGKFDLDWIFDNIHIVNNEIVYDQKSLFAIENYLLARYHMYMQIYNHKIGISFDNLLVKIFTRIKNLVAKNFNFKTDITWFKFLWTQNLSLEEEINNYLQLDDYSVTTLFKFLAQSETDSILVDLTTRFINRRFFKLIFIKNAAEITKIKEILIAQKFDLDYYLIIDTFEKPTIYQQTNDEQPIKLINNLKEIYNLEKKSKLVSNNKNAEIQKFVLVPKEIEKLIK